MTARRMLGGVLGWTRGAIPPSSGSRYGNMFSSFTLCGRINVDW